MDRIGSEVERELARSGGQPALPLAAITAVWPEAVGDAVAQAGVATPSRPRRNAPRRDVVGDLGVRARPAFRRRSSTHFRRVLGTDAPKKLRFAVGPIPEPAARESRTTPASAEPPEPTSEEAAAAASAAADDRRSGAPRARRPGRPREPRSRPGPAAVSDRLTRPRNMAICRAFLMAEAAYTAKDITVLEGLEPVRLRPGMYIGSTGSRGLHHLVYEVVDNAVDEALAGRNDLVDVTIHPDNSVTVRDAGAGIPVDVIADQGLPALTVVLTKLHAGGKFGGEGYKVSGGLHGVGVSVVNALSEWLVAEVRRDGKVYRQEFARGEPDDGHGDRRGGGQGRVRNDDLVPSRPEVFEETEFDAATLLQRLRETAFLTRGLRIVLRDERAGGRTDEFLLRGRDPGLRRARQRVEGPGAQAHRLLRGRERRGDRRGRDAVEQLVRRVRVLVREQHQHDRGRDAPPGLPSGAHPDAQPVRAPGRAC